VLNIFFDINYIKTKKVFLTRSLRHSKFINLIINSGNIFKIPISERFIFSGPHKRMNNILKTFKGPNFSINKKKFKNNYIVNFDSGSESLLQNLLKDSNSKILIGPLFNVEYQKKLIEYTNEYPNIKKLVASDAAYNNAVYELGLNVQPENVYVCPSGVISKKELNKNRAEYKRDDKCLVYFKKREKKDLRLVLNFLESMDIKYELFEYGKYNNKDLLKAAKKNRFGVYMSRVETQGFAVQELMACNLPLYVWDDLKSNAESLSKYYGGGNFSGTTVTLWSENNGIIVNNYKEFEDKFEEFLLNLNNYDPTKLVDEYLTFESFQNKLLSLFSKF
tara:strand:+ start:14884 stop:15885 length:1002 start_codon:yes stop_codon:yes gene_type:complete